MSLTTRIPMCVAAVTVAYNYAVITLCSVGIWRRVKNNAEAATSKKSQALNGQMNQMLIIQVNT